MKNNLEKTYLAGGCFWGVDYHLQKINGVVATEVGYMGGHTKTPTYEQVCSQRTGHAETVAVTFDPGLVSFSALAQLFFEIHDSTQLDRQGPDVGDQYRSEIFYTNDEQKQIALELIATLKQQGIQAVTRVSPAPHFWPAENYHQAYYQKNRQQPYCHVRKPIFARQ